MIREYDKESLKEFICNLIDALDDGTYTVEGTFGWSYLKQCIKKVEE